MIELFDSARLLPQRDRSLPAAAALALAGATAVAAHGLLLQQQLGGLAAQKQTLQAELSRHPAAATAAAPTPQLLAELQRQAEQLEAEAAAGPGTDAGASLTAAQWLERLDALGNPEIGVTRVEIDRGGAVRVEGLARNPQALSAYVQGWERFEAMAPVRARDIEVRQDPAAAPLLRFTLRAQAAGAAPPAGATP